MSLPFLRFMKAVTEEPEFCCWHFQMHFIKRKSCHFDHNFVLKGPTNSKSTLYLATVTCLAPSHFMNNWWPSSLMDICIIWACFLSLAWSKLRLCSANHRAGYFSNLACDWLSIVWAYFEQETESGPWSQCVNTLRSRQNGCHFADDILKCIFLMRMN